MTENTLETSVESDALIKIKQLAFRTRNQKIIEITSWYFELIDGLSNHLPKNQMSLEEEWLQRVNTFQEDNPSFSLGDALLSSLLESRLPYLTVTNNRGFRWSPFEMDFVAFSNCSLSIEVKLESIAVFKMRDLLGVDNA